MFPHDPLMECQDGCGIIRYTVVWPCRVVELGHRHWPLRAASPLRKHYKPHIIVALACIPTWKLQYNNTVYWKVILI